MDERLVRCSTLRLVGALAVAFIVASPSAAQTVSASGNANVTDISGTTITTGDFVGGLFLGEPGPVQTLYCPAATGVRNVGLAVASELERGVFYVARQNPGVVLLARETQEDLLAHLTGKEGGGGLEAALTGPENDHRAARATARDLEHLLDGLITAVTRMDPHRPGHRAPTRLFQAVASFNTFVNASSEEFLRNPPDEFLAVQTVLSRLVIAALENEGRPEVCGVLPPPPPAPADPPPPPPVVERAVSICLMVDEELREVPAIVIPSTGDSLVVVEGERRPLSEVYPPAVYEASAELAGSDAPIALGGRTYLKFGLPRAVRPEALERKAAFHGVGLFFERGAASPPEVLYVPVGQGCVVQPYERQEVVRRVDG